MLKHLSIIKKYIEWFCSFSLIPSIFEHVSYMGGGGGGGGVLDHSQNPSDMGILFSYYPSDLGYG